MRRPNGLEFFENCLGGDFEIRKRYFFSANKPCSYKVAKPINSTAPPNYLAIARRIPARKCPVLLLPIYKYKLCIFFRQVIFRCSRKNLIELWD